MRNMAIILTCFYILAAAFLIMTDCESLPAHPDYEFICLRK